MKSGSKTIQLGLKCLAVSSVISMPPGSEVKANEPFRMAGLRKWRQEDSPHACKALPKVPESEEEEAG